MGKLINRIPGSRLLISSLPGKALRMHVDIAQQASRCQHAFSKPCLVNLISKDTHLVFSIYNMKQELVTDYFGKHGNEEGFTTILISIRPRLRGELKLKSEDPFDYPSINPR